MNRCPHCDSPIEAGTATCPGCGREVVLQPGGSGTIQQQDSDLAGTRKMPGIPDDSPPQATKEQRPGGSTTWDGGTGTVTAPGVGDKSGTADTRSAKQDTRSTMQDTRSTKHDTKSKGAKAKTDSGADETNLNETVAAGSTERDEVVDGSGTYSTLTTHEDDPPADSDAGDVQATMLSGEGQSTEVSDDGHSTFIPNDADRPLDKTDRFPGSGPGTADPRSTQILSDRESDSDTHGTHLSTDDVGSTHVSSDAGRPASSGSPADQAGTVILPGSHKEEDASDQTLIYESKDVDHATHDASGPSGTEGRLKRLWEGVAGSSENPMHSLQADAQQASDSVFQRVATRRVADANMPNDQSADYQIVDKLGEGAMGIVFSARQTAVNRIVAIKTAKPNFQKSDETRRRFLYEAHITADLDHSNIVPIHELGASEEGMLFYSMKLVQGTEWSRVMKKKSREQNLEIFMKVTDAIAFAHSKGVIHRDLKPENTMLGRFGEVFVTDWGTAVNLDKDTTRLALPAKKGEKSLTVEDASNFVRGDSIVLHDGSSTFDRIQIVSIDEVNPNRLYLRKKLSRDYEPSPNLSVVKAMNLAGTPCYMAPEMAGHQLPKIGKTSDIYILGAILYDMVTGKAPHRGKSVTECLRAALKNDVVIADNDDPLLRIAFKAMSSDPGDRYQTVEALQDAVREYRRHAESIALTERSDDLLVAAEAQKDYEMFSRTLFGYRDAIELWPGNLAAVNGLNVARLAFGQVAYKKGDYDLVLQTLDRSVPAESELYDQAVSAKKRSAGREAALKLLQRVVAAVVLFAVVGLTGLSIYAFSERTKAVRLAATNLSLAQSEKEAADAAMAAAEKEKAARELAVAAQMEAEDAAKREEEAKDLAVMAKQEAETAAKREEEAKKVAENAAKREETQRIIAEDAEKLARRRAAEIQLGEYVSSLALAKSQIESYDVAAGRDNLDRLQQIFGSKTQDVDVFAGRTPDIDTWGWQRVRLLSNMDLPSTRIAARVSASDYAPQADMAVVGTADGLIQILQFGPQGLSKTREYIEAGAAINTVAISPKGDEVVYGFSSGDVGGVKRWLLSEDSPLPVNAAKNRQFQRMAYTPDGQNLVAGINGGIWIWQRQADWFNRESASLRFDSIRGELTNLQAISPRQMLLTARFQDRLLLAILDIQTGSTRLITLPEELQTNINSAAHTLLDNKIALGLKDNRLVVGTLSADESGLLDYAELEEKHRAPVTRIVANGNGKLATSSSAEPVVHVWQYAEDQWSYDTYLTGTPTNMAGVGLLGADKVLGIDAEGMAIVWDVERQKQRRRMERLAGSGEFEYAAPVRDVYAGDSGGMALAIDDNGAVDLWSLTDGSTQRMDGRRWSYIGHTPGAEFVDSAVDIQRGIVITAASLRNAERKYLSSPQDWEFCLWNLSSGEMQRRWTTSNRQVGGEKWVETIEQRISLLDNGQQILFASDNETRLVDLDGAESFRRTDFGSYFAVPNPRDSSLAMLVKRSGAVRLLDLDDLNSWENESYRNFDLADPIAIPLRGVWSDDGRRFYLTFSTGGLAAFHFTGGQLELRWSTRGMQDQSPLRPVYDALIVENGRVRSHLDIDMLVTNENGSDVVHVATRSRGLDPSTKLVSVQFAGSQQTPTLFTRPLVVAGIEWLQDRDGKPPTLTDRLHDVLIVDSHRVRGRQRFAHQTFVSTDAAQVFGLVDGEVQSVSYGRPPLISTTGSRDGRTIYALLQDGAIWKFELTSTNEPNWQRLSFTARETQKLQLSPDGSQLLLLNDGVAKLVNPETGDSLQELNEVSAACWDPRQPARLAVAHINGSVELLAEGASKTLDIRIDATRGQLIGMHFFVESWNDDQPPREHLLVHSESDTDGSLAFIPLDDAPGDAVKPAEQQATKAAPITKGARLAVSPHEGIIVTGTTNGSVTVWFATPTYDSAPRQLFDLEGHRGAEITCLAFTSDGRTIITADDKNRLFAWLSRDPLEAHGD